MKKQLRWILLLLALGAACLALWLWPRPGGTLAGVYQDGRLLYTLDPGTDQVLTVSGPAGENTIAVSNGEIRVTHADCPDQICVQHGPLRQDGSPIICLPNHLTIRWIGGDGQIDALTGTGGLQ